MTFDVIHNQMKNMRIHNVGIHLNFDQNRFINEYARKNFLNPRREVRTDGIVRFIKNLRS